MPLKVEKIYKFKIFFVLEIYGASKQDFNDFFVLIDLTKKIYIYFFLIKSHSFRGAFALI
jgi:hypothetical protein